MSHCHGYEVSAESQVDSAGGGFVGSSQVCRDCADCFELPDAKWSVFSCATKSFRAGLVICKLVTYQPCYTLQAPHIG